MRFNSKNYPTYRSYKGIIAAPLTYEEWGKGFKKELREKLRTFTAYQGTLNQCDKDFIKFIKEIWGE